MRVPAAVSDHRHLTCLLPPWRFAHNRVVFRLFRGCCARQQQLARDHRRRIREQQASSSAAASVSVNSYDRSDTSSYWINDQGVNVGQSGGPTGGNRRLLHDSPLVQGVPGDVRYKWDAVQMTIEGNVVAGGISFRFTQGWQSLEPSCGVIGAGIPVSVFGYGFNASAPYVCVFSGTGSGNISRYSDELQVPAGNTSCQALFLR